MFHQNLKRCRQAAGLTQAQLAVRLRVPKRTYEGWEFGRSQPKLDMVVSIGALLGVTTDALLIGETKRRGEK
jgi:transcriptional regulator with XRE-family HTH domain